MNTSEAPLVVDEAGPIRYDWPQIKLLYVAGAGCTDLARSITKDVPEEFERVRGAIAMKCSREEWQKLREAGRAIVSAQSPSTKNNGSAQLQSVSTTIAGSIFAQRKNKYLDVASEFIDRSADHLKSQTVTNLVEASAAAKLMEPIHKLAVDIHGLNAKDSPAALQVNFLGTPEECKVTLDVKAEPQD